MEVHTSYDSLITDLRALATHIARGGYVEWSEPEPRGRKGPDRRQYRLVTIKIEDPARFDAYRWQLLTRQLSKAKP